ncbi:hypothetical protein [Bradyrhizobium sp. Tv2a-2]|uniref:hypothetical protein n=1 Tax=Bradyrhizobium sp. Tv2a-2 TaxID=113395 RepID=UPI000428154C|nr:hypothetical protein [Bradyrhizobium sp. Tv2a-2]
MHESDPPAAKRDVWFVDPLLVTGVELDLMIKAFGLAPRTIGNDGQPTAAPLSDHELRQRFIDFALKRPSKD